METDDITTRQAVRFPAGRHTINIVGGKSPIKASNFCMGLVTLDTGCGQVPWHNHEQEEIYFILEGKGEMCVAEEKQNVSAGQVIFVPGFAYHQLTNTGSIPLKFIYCYGPAGEVAHWRQELAGTLPRAGEDAPNLPPGAIPQLAGVSRTS